MVRNAALIGWLTLGIAVMSFAPALAEESKLATQLRRPTALALSSDEAWLYVANQRSGSISAIDTAKRTAVAEQTIGKRLSALVAIPKELYEAAEADGAGANARFWHITLPLLKPVLAVVVLFSTIFTFSDFNIVYVLTHGGPINSTHLFATLSRQIGIDTGRLGEGAAISLYLFPLLAFVVWVQLRFVRKQAY